MPTVTDAQIAIHEAAHGVLAVLLNIPFDSLNVESDRPGGHVQFDQRYYDSMHRLGNNADKRRMLILTMAGPLAEERFTRGEDTVIGDDTDKADVKQLLSYLATRRSDRRSFAKYIREHTRSLVNSRWPAILAVAKALHKQKNLPAAVVEQIVSNSSGNDATD